MIKLTIASRLVRLNDETVKNKRHDGNSRVITTGVDKVRRYARLQVKVRLGYGTGIENLIVGDMRWF